MSVPENSIIIPAFNEEAVLGGFLESLQGILQNAADNYEVIVIDDGSSDNTFAIASNVSSVKVIRHPYNKGNGAAVKTGITEAKGKNVIIIDSDGQMDPKLIPDMVKKLDEYDLVVGAREYFGAGKRGFGNILVSRLASYLSGLHIPDLTSGYRAFKKEKMLEFLDLLPNGFSLPSTSTLAFATSGYNVKFIPIVPIVRQGGKSSIKVFRDGMKFIILIFRMVSLFKPLKVFVPISVFLLLFGVLWSVRAYLMTKVVSSLGVMFLLAGIFIFMIGLLTDQISEMRMSLGKMKKHLMKKPNEMAD